MHDPAERLIDFAKVRSLIPMNDVLTLLAWEPTSIQGSQLRGGCPLPNCPSTSRRTFCVHLEKQLWHCFGCQRHGNHLDLWSMLTELDLYHAAIDLCGQVSKPVPILARLQNPSSLNSRRNSPAGPQ